MMELNERETLIKVEQQLNDSAQNQTQIMSDLKEIFQRIESESKIVTTIRGDLKGHSDNSRLRWESLEKRLESIEKLEDKIENNEKSISNLKEEQGKFEEQVKSSARVTKWIIGIIAAVGSMIGTLALLFEIFEKIKG